MKVLILATDYPRPDGYVASYFIHSRNLYYKEKLVDVTVLNFNSKNDYYVDGIRVICLNSYEKKIESFDLLLSHAPNLRNHYRFLRKNKKKFHDILFFFHGHEVLKQNEVYPKPYDFVKKDNTLKLLIGNLYDQFKILIWRRFFNKNYTKLKFIFVSNWMFNKFNEFIKMDLDKLETRNFNIYNCIGEKFLTNSYDFKSEKKYDFITIRNLLDKSKYAIDIVNEIAKENPDYSFCIVGKGEYFNHYGIAANVEFVDKHLAHQEVLEYLNESRCALMPTRADAQGVMVCEMATYGIPVITSDIEVCKEVLGDFPNVTYMDNDIQSINSYIDLNEVFNSWSTNKNEKFNIENTINKELELMNNILESNKNV
ncbi:glycosyltransferase family 4 protein [Clostridium sp.]|uniref:glycosyltransferase family 4 protein n=1 Tax=Clostridium sp. TaxID=1506 RepID=UPI0026203456|nr:glycosyltransferase family 4 protein [Clostridium sp.]